MELNKILNDLNQYKGKDKSEVLANHIQNRLSSSLNNYYKELSKTIDYLAYRENIRVIKKINADS